jgi:hypothetical protein
VAIFSAACQRANGWMAIQDARLNTFGAFSADEGKGHLWLAAPRQAEVGIVATELARCPLQGARASI